VALSRIRFENVVQRFRVIRERPDTLREVFTRVFRRGSRVYDFNALKGVSFTIADGEAVGVVGRNGSGKSTTLKIIAGVYRPSSGRVEVSGKVAPLIELGAGFHGDLTGRENIVLNGLLLGLSRREIMAREDRIVAFSGLGDFIDSPVKQYSSGMYMRLGFAVATEVDPDILLIDEILAVGDADFQQKCMARIEDFRQRGKTIVLVSHAVATIQQLCPRAIFLDGGTIVADGPAGEVLARYIESLEGHQEAPHLTQEGARARG
jgi:ABC-type polysaccharide/polyol phosphate transport system ATPase subunit